MLVLGKDRLDWIFWYSVKDGETFLREDMTQIWVKLGPRSMALYESLNTVDVPKVAEKFALVEVVPCCAAKGI